MSKTKKKFIGCYDLQKQRHCHLARIGSAILTMFLPNILIVLIGIGFNSTEQHSKFSFLLGCFNNYITLHYI